MKLKVLSSGSIGNCYILETENETLVIDCGIPFKEIKIGLDFDLSRVVGVIVSHSHQDHSKSVTDFKKYGVDVWQPYLDEKKIQKKRFGGFKIQCFDLPHNGIENRGFLIEADGQKILYMTDLEYCKYNFSGLQVEHVMCECNYSMEFVDRNEPNYEHRLRGHMSLDTALKFISTNDNPALRNVVLIHLSDKSGNPTLFKQKVVETLKYDTEVYVAENGLEVDFNLYPF